MYKLYKFDTFTMMWKCLNCFGSYEDANKEKEMLSKYFKANYKVEKEED